MADLSSTVTVRNIVRSAEGAQLFIRTPATADGNDTIDLDTVPALVSVAKGSTIDNVFSTHTLGATVVGSSWVAATNVITLGTGTNVAYDLVVWIKY